jgi:hypothetical protein
MNRPLTKKRIVIALCTLVLTGLSAVGTVGYLTFLRSPANPPADACADGRPKSSGPVVVAAGASMTQGTLGRDWVGDLREKPEFRGYEFVNAGDNGNTSADLRGRVDSDIVACDPDRYSWDEVARDNGLELFVDHIHLSDRGGAMVTDVAAQWLSSTEGATKSQP